MAVDLAGGRIVDVWQDNVQQEFIRIQNIVADYPVIAMDTEFPGEVFQMFSMDEASSYEKLKKNCDRLKLIQVGFSFGKKDGTTKDGTSTWQFNLQFDTNTDQYARSSLDMLLNAGLDFDKHRKDGIDPSLFCELLWTSGIMLNDEVDWVTFHSSYDFGYMTKVATGEPLPDTEHEFKILVDKLFPSRYDLKLVSGTRRGLNILAAECGIVRKGSMHQAGSDALITLETYFQIINNDIKWSERRQEFYGRIAGIGKDIFLYVIDQVSNPTDTSSENSPVEFIPNNNYFGRTNNNNASITTFAVSKSKWKWKQLKLKYKFEFKFKSNLELKFAFGQCETF
ncbi:MAG: putative CCR4-NOT transcription complex subunit 8 [Streblomastix strix]|uniref:poly(A)-specific ribonuclease n=1 Tax=Streblomastix strix TaxID=222440 RepID=A0A5J4VIV0_9EUKA|nr:MAG: putative CCR4-NOT transcription complex subunit 8 [Streblomastix strix]